MSCARRHTSWAGHRPYGASPGRDSAFRQRATLRRGAFNSAGGSGCWSLAALAGRLSHGTPPGVCDSGGGSHGVISRAATEAPSCHRAAKCAHVVCVCVDAGDARRAGVVGVPRGCRDVATVWETYKLQKRHGEANRVVRFISRLVGAQFNSSLRLSYLQ